MPCKVANHTWVANFYHTSKKPQFTRKCMIRREGGDNSMNELEQVHDLDYLFRIGEEAAAEGETDKALHFIEKVLSINPKHAEAWNIKGNCLDRKGSCEDALSSYDTAIKLDPTNADYLFNKAETLEKMGRLSEAKTTMDIATKMEMGE
jgi:tetratricopeptide (TPR) repeat protein